MGIVHARRQSRRTVKQSHTFALVVGVALLGYVAYVAAPKHPMRIVERVVDGHAKIGSTWSRVLSDDGETFGTIDWRAQVHRKPGQPPFAIILRSSKPGRWTEDGPEAGLVCDGRQIRIGCRRADVVEGETARASFLVCIATMEELAALASAKDAALVVNGRRWSFGSSGPGTFRELKRRADSAARD